MASETATVRHARLEGVFKLLLATYLYIYIDIYIYMSNNNL